MQILYLLTKQTSEPQKYPKAMVFIPSQTVKPKRKDFTNYWMKNKKEKFNIISRVFCSIYFD